MGGALATVRGVVAYKPRTEAFLLLCCSLRPGGVLSSSLSAAFFFPAPSSRRLQTFRLFLVSGLVCALLEASSPPETMLTLLALASLVLLGIGKSTEELSGLFHLVEQNFSSRMKGQRLDELMKTRWRLKNRLRG